MTRAPEKMPAEPTPAMALPMIRAMDDGATPHMSEPSSNMPMAMRYTHLMLKKV